MKLKVEKVGHSGFNVPFGYAYRGGVLEIIPEEAEIVKFIYSQYLSGKSLSRIVTMLNSRRIPTKRSGTWAKKTVSGMLKNPVYCGYHRFEDKLTKGKHTILIDTASFRKTQKVLCKKGGKQRNYDFGEIFQH